MNYPNLERLIEIIDILRSENGCKWDREQTHSSLRKNMLEEAYEAVDAIDDNDFKGKFIIIADDSDMCHLLPLLVRCDCQLGFTG